MENARVMIVDDEPRNLDVLGDMLRREGYALSAFPRGDFALAAAREDPPDIVLLDIRMPRMDGYEVCRRFKEERVLRDVPIIFLSALSDSAAKVRAFDEGGVDYVTKPLNAAEVLARVRAHLELRFHRVRLEQLVRRRSEQLFEAHRRLRVWDRAKTQWLNTISHEMRTPLTGLLGISDLMFEELPAGSQLLDLREVYDISRNRIEKLIKDAEALARIDVASDAFELTPESLSECLAQALDVALARHLSENMTVEEKTGNLSGAVVLCEPKLIERAFADLLSTAFLCTREKETIVLESELSDKEVLVRIVTRGGSLPPGDLEVFFDIGGQRTLLREGGDLGLGPALARKILELFKGCVRVKNGPERGIVLQATLPLFNGVDNGKKEGL